MVAINLIGFDATFPKTVRVEATTYKEAIEMLKLQDKFNPLKQMKRFLCKVLECPNSKDLKSRIVGSEINMVLESVVNNRFRGSGDQKVQVVLGVILIIVGIIVTIWNPALGVQMQIAGYMMIVGAVVAHLMRPEEQIAEERQSRIAQRYPNTVASGTPKAIILGKHRYGGHLISMNIESKEGVELRFEEFVGQIWDASTFNSRDSWETIYQNTNTGGYGSIDSGDSGGGIDDNDRAFIKFF